VIILSSSISKKKVTGLHSSLSTKKITDTHNVINDESIAGASGARANKPASGDRISDAFQHDANKREFQTRTRHAVKQARERAAAERTATVTQRAIVSKMDEERPTRLIEINAEADESATIRTEWIGGGRRSPDNAVYNVPTVKSKSSIEVLKAKEALKTHCREDRNAQGA